MLLPLWLFLSCRPCWGTVAGWQQLIWMKSLLFYQVHVTDLGMWDMWLRHAEAAGNKQQGMLLRGGQL